MENTSWICSKLTMRAVALIFAMQLLNADMVRDPETPSHLQMPAVTATVHVDLRASPPRNASITVSAHAKIAVPARNVSTGEGRVKAEETQKIPPVPLPPRGKAELLEKSFGLGDKVPVLVIGSMTHEFFTARQRLLFFEVFHTIKKIRPFQATTVFVGHSANGRTPPERRFADWQFRGSVFDCIPQERAAEMIGIDNSLMLTFEEKDKGDFNVMGGPRRQKLMLGPEQTGVIKDASDIRKKAEETEVQVMRIQVPDIGALPDEQPPQWNGVASVIQIALVLGGGPRAIQEVAERDGESDFTKEVDAKARLTLENYPYKPNALFVFAVGGLPAGQIMDSGPEKFKPGPVLQEHWLKLIDKDEVAHFASTAEPDDETEPRAEAYAFHVAMALGNLIEAACPQFNCPEL